MLTPFRWGVTSAQRTHIVRFFMTQNHVTCMPCQCHVFALRTVEPCLLSTMNTSVGPLLSSPSSWGLRSSQGTWGSLSCSVWQKGEVFGNHTGSFCSLYLETLSLMKVRLMSLLRVSQLLMTFYQRWEICWAWREWGLATGCQIPLFLERLGGRVAPAQAVETCSWVLPLAFTCITRGSHSTSLSLFSPL